MTSFKICLTTGTIKEKSHLIYCFIGVTFFGEGGWSLKVICPNQTIHVLSALTPKSRKFETWASTKGGRSTVSHQRWSLDGFHMTPWLNVCRCNWQTLGCPSDEERYHHLQNNFRLSITSLILGQLFKKLRLNLFQMKTRLWLQEDCRLAALRGFQGLARGEAEAEEAEAEQPALVRKPFPIQNWFYFTTKRSIGFKRT